MSFQPGSLNNMRVSELVANLESSEAFADKCLGYARFKGRFSGLEGPLPKTDLTL